MGALAARPAPSAAARCALTLVVACVVLWLPSLAEACAVCSAGRDEQNRLAFMLMTGFMTGLPLALIFGLGWWLRRELKRRDREIDEERAHANRSVESGRAGDPSRGTARSGPVAVSGTRASSHLRAT